MKIIVQLFISIFITSYTFSKNEQAPFAFPANSNGFIQLSIVVPHLQTMHENVEQCMEGTTYIHSWITENKLKFCLYSASAFYIALNAYLLYLQKQIQAADNWSLWKQELSAQELNALAPETLADILLHELQERYTTVNSLENFSEPLVVFFSAIEAEEKYLRSYQWFCWWCKKFFIAKIMWIDEPLLAACTPRLKRLAYIKKVFVQWMARYKIKKHAQFFDASVV